MPPQLAFLFLLIAVIIHFVYPWPRIISSPYHYGGLILIFLGFSLSSWAISLFKKNNTPLPPSQTPTTLVLEGPYRISRNPIYAGITLILLGIAVLGATIPLFFAPLAFFMAMNYSIIPYEERKMAKLFGKSDLNYKRRVRRWM